MFDRDSRTWVWIAAGLVAVIAIWQWGVVPLHESRAELLHKVKKERVRTRELEALEQDYRRLAGSSGGQMHTTGKFNLYAFLEPLAKRDGLRSNIAFMRPGQKLLNDTTKEESVEMRLTGVNMDQLVPYLYHVQNSRHNIAVRRLTIRSQPSKRNLLDVDIQFSVQSAV